ncbi:MAG TPA: YkgJ family cysteine cluster protein, partial [Thermoanaerobaculia bacterium]
MADDRYHRVLEKADLHFRTVANTQPQNLQCGAGCSLCCYGLFEIGSGDLPIISEGLDAMEPATRHQVVSRALAIVTEMKHPNLRECSSDDKEAFFERTKATPCPNLDEAGHCVMYAHRPLVCRTFGLPLRDG